MAASASATAASGIGAGLLADYQTAATYLGLTPAQLRTDLMGGKTLADDRDGAGQDDRRARQHARRRRQKQLDAAVTAGKLTSTQEQAIEKNLQQMITDLVNGKRPTAMVPGMFGGPNFRGPRSFGKHGFRQPGKAPAPSTPQNPA